MTEPSSSSLFVLYLLSGFIISAVLIVCVSVCPDTEIVSLSASLLYFPLYGSYMEEDGLSLNEKDLDLFDCCDGLSSLAISLISRRTDALRFSGMKFVFKSCIVVFS